MRAFKSLAAAFVLFSCLAHGRPVSEKVETRGTTSTCLAAADAAHLVNSYALLLNSSFSYARAADILATEYLEYSDSINFLAGVPLSLPIFSSLAAFEASQVQQEPIPLQLLSIDAVSCTNIAWRWLAYPGSGINEVKGINTIYAAQGTGSSNGWQIAVQFTEFNSASYNLDIGGTSVPPAAPSRFSRKDKVPSV